MFVKKYPRLALAPLLVTFVLCSLGRAEFELNPFSAGTSWDYGMIVKGRFSDEIAPIADGQTLTRTGVFINQSGTFNERLSLSVTIGGILFRSLPERKAEFETKILYPGGSLGEAKAAYVFGDPEEPFAEIKAGFFPIKYNPDVKNLGEYLYRSGTYPSVLYSGGWSYVNSAAYMGQGIGFRLNTFGGKWVHDITITLERDLEPTNDISPAYVSTFKAGFLEFGLGLQWAHLIPLKPDSVVTPRVGDAFNRNMNAYVKEGAPYANAGLPLAYDDTSGEIFNQHYSTGDSRVRPDGDSLIGTTVADPNDPNFGQEIISESANGIPGEFLDYYTFRGIKTMARASLDIGTLLGLQESLGPDGFKIYSEVALLGLQDQPYFYEDKSERMPVMFGINIPTFKLLDVLAFEVEYRKSRFPNDIGRLFENQFPIPLSADVTDYSLYDADHPRYTDLNHSSRMDAVAFLGLEGDPRYDQNHPDYEEANAVADLRPLLQEQFERDDWKWSLYARKSITEGLSITAQAASDHLRHFEIKFNGPRPSDFPTTRFPKEWYFILRLELGI